MKDFLHNIYTSFLPILLLFLTFIQPITFILLSVVTFIIIDIMFAYWRVIHKKEKWNYIYMFLQFSSKIIVYTGFVLGVYILDFGIVNEFLKLFSNIEFFLTKIFAIVLIFSELKSIDKSFKVIKGKSLFKYLFDLINFFKEIKNKISEVGNKKETDKTEE